MNDQYLSISQINNFIRMMFDENTYLKKVYLKGEISNFKNHSSGHLYLTLKDEEARISAIMFKSSACKLNFVPEDGMKVLVTGRISVYPAGGNYQIYIDEMEPDGLGTLYIEFEKLKRKLQSEGLFASVHKRPIPKYPSKIGIVTSPTGAAIKDILSTIQRRFPSCKTILFPALVQGASAACDIAHKINIANTFDLDLLIVGRGGGSIEDLWAFNEEVVARAIYNSSIPVISAVGHEVDVTIADFVADLRAPTPTGAAEMAVPTVMEVKNILKNKQLVIANILDMVLTKGSLNLKKLASSYILNNPMTLYEMKMQKLDTLTEKLSKSLYNYFEVKKIQLNNCMQTYVLQNPNLIYEGKGIDLANKKVLLKKNIKQIMTKKESDMHYILQTLKLVNPLNILDKGYSVVKKDGHIIKDSSNIKIQDILSIRLSKGEVNVLVKEIRS